MLSHPLYTHPPIAQLARPLPCSLPMHPSAPAAPHSSQSIHLVQGKPIALHSQNRLIIFYSSAPHVHITSKAFTPQSLISPLTLSSRSLRTEDSLPPSQRRWSRSSSSSPAFRPPPQSSASRPLRSPSARSTLAAALGWEDGVCVNIPTTQMNVSKEKSLLLH